MSLRFHIQYPSNDFIVKQYYGSTVWKKPCHEKTCYAICEQQRRRSAYASVQSDQRLCFRCLDSNTSSFYIQNFKPLPSFCGCSGQFESTLVENPEDRISCDVARISIGPGQVRKRVLCHMRTTKAQISLHIRAVWSAPLLFAA